jgi:hypothetical protein
VTCNGQPRLIAGGTGWNDNPRSIRHGSDRIRDGIEDSDGGVGCATGGGPKVFSVICLFSLSSKDPKVTDRCSAAGPEVFLVGLVLAFLLNIDKPGHPGQILRLEDKTSCQQRNRNV